MLVVKPINLKTANAYVRIWHRHIGPARGCKFSLQIQDEFGETKGILIAGRPVSRHLDNGSTLEVSRLCTDGAPNACSKLYGAAARIAKQMGYARIITYTLPSESGSSLRAVGWKPIDGVGGGDWSRRNRNRVCKAPTGKKIRWEKSFRKEVAKSKPERANAKRGNVG